LTKSNLELIDEKLEEIFEIKRHQAKLIKELDKKLHDAKH